MPITFECEACGKSFTVADHMGGKKGLCKQCGATILVPTVVAEPDAYGLDLAAPEPVARAAVPPQTSVFTPSATAREADRSPKRRKTSSKGSSGALMGPGGYNNDKIRFVVGAILVVGFILFRVWIKTSIRNQRHQGEQPGVQGLP